MNELKKNQDNRKIRNITSFKENANISKIHEFLSQIYKKFLSNY
jgi:hypothetical protein